MTDNRDSDLRPEFRAHLEWQIASALRREDRFAEPVGAGPRRWRTAIAVVLALLVGAGAMAASGEVQENRQRDALIEAARAEEALNRMRLQLAEAEYADARRKFEAGVVGREGVQAAEAELQAMRAALARLALNAEEIKATAQAPRDDLQAPLVGQRDFVAERLKLELASVQQSLRASEQALVEARKRVEVGLASPATQLEADAQVASLTARLQQLAETLELRRRALAGTLQSDALALALRRIELTSQMQHLQKEFEAVRARVEAARRLFTVGQLSELDVKRAELELLEREIALTQLRRELEKVKKF
jgi:outer membrane protein TolC